MRSCVLCFLIVVVNWIFTSPTYAVLQGVVSKKTYLYVDSDSESEVITELNEGQKINVGSRRENGMIRVKTRGGRLGWVLDTDVKVEGGLPETPREERPARRPPRENSELTESQQLGKSEPNRLIRFLFGLDLFNLNGITDVISTQGLTVANGLYFGGEFGFLLGRLFTLSLRLDYLSKSVTATDQSNRQFDFSSRSLPIMAGLSVQIPISSVVDLGIAGYGGVGFLTEFSSTGVNLSAPNKTSLSAAPFASMFLARVEVHSRSLGNLSFFGEGGYRILKTDSLTPAEALGEVNGNNLYAPNGTYQAVPIDFSGLFFCGGLGFHF